MGSGVHDACLCRFPPYSSKGGDVTNQVLIGGACGAVVPFWYGVGPRCIKENGHGEKEHEGEASFIMGDGIMLGMTVRWRWHTGLGK